MFLLEQMEIFYAVGTWKSFTKAAYELGVSKGYVSSQISALEKTLGIKLLHRTTRYLELTEEGNVFFESCNKIVAEKKAALAVLNDAKTIPSGLLKITAPPSLCDTVLVNLLPMFQLLYPNITLDIDSSANVKNLLQHGMDIALRITHLPDERYIAKLITTFKFTVCATKKYLAQHGTPKTPQELMSHNCLIYSSDPARNIWPFQNDNKIITVSVKGNLVSTNSILIKNSLLAHQGVARLPSYMIEDKNCQNEIKVLFTEKTKMEVPIYAIYHSHPNIPSKVTAFVKFLKDNL